jgi:tetratricopeptide (TPR) repeat protein
VKNAQRFPIVPAEDLVQLILEGKDIYSCNRTTMRPSGNSEIEVEPKSCYISGIALEDNWEEGIRLMYEAAAKSNDNPRMQQIEALRTLIEVTGGIERRGYSLPNELESILQLARHCGARSVHTCITGQLGVLIGWPHGVALLEEASGIAIAAGLRWAECQWAIDLGAICARHDGDAAEKWLSKGLELARSLGDLRRSGIASHNLAVLYAQRPSSLCQAKQYGLEAVANAARAGQTVELAQRTAHLGELCERLGQRREAITYYSKALDMFRELKHARTFELVRHLANIITEPLEQNATPVLLEHLELNRTMSISDFVSRLASVKDGELLMGGSSGSKFILMNPDNAFAMRLFERADWCTLAVYARYWVEHGFTSGDSVGLHWLSISFRNLGFDEAAEACLEFGLRVADFYEPTVAKPQADSNEALKTSLALRAGHTPDRRETIPIWSKISNALKRLGGWLHVFH